LTDPGDETSELARAWAPPSELAFTPTLTSIDGELRVEGELVNTSDAEMDVYLWDAGMGYLHLGLIGDGITMRDIPVEGPREVYPQFSHFRFVPGARWSIGASLLPECWHFTPGATARVGWSLHLAGSEPSGELPVTLP